MHGFWGEWHTWSYDGWIPPKENWTPSSTVYTEVLMAFDSAFARTPLCLKEPKAGILNSTADEGYHDDSYGYATFTSSFTKKYGISPGRFRSEIASKKISEP